MTHVLYTRNVNTAYRAARQLIRTVGCAGQSRNGPVYRAIYPVVTHTACPMERVLFDPRRDANPFFHFFEGLWMLAGRRDVEFLAFFNKRMRTYSDDGTTFHGAYGHRLRQCDTHRAWAEDVDQLQHIVTMLRRDPTDRRTVASIWDSNKDLWAPETMDTLKDVPCNVTLKFQRNPVTLGLDLIVFNRSNDILWGCYGANAVHFPMIQEYVAHQLNWTVGEFIQISTDWHWYGELPRPTEDPGEESNLYITQNLRPMPMVAGDEDPGYFDEDLRTFFRLAEETQMRRIPLDDPDAGTLFKLRWFATTVWPLWVAHARYRRGTKEDHALALVWAELVAAQDWRAAAVAWLQRREAKYSPTL